LASKADAYAEQLSKIPDFARLGPLFRSSDPVNLTEAETEYIVVLIKHVFADAIVLQFDCRNTLSDQLLEHVSVELEVQDEDGAGAGWAVEKTIPLEKLPYGQEGGKIYCLVSLPDDGHVTGTFTATLKFQVKDVDPTTGEPESEDHYGDTYVLEDVEIAVSDHIQRVTKANFAAAWEQLGAEHENEESFSLSTVTTIPDAITQLVKVLGLGICERSERVPEGKSAHTLLLAGVFRGGHEILGRIRLALDPNDHTVSMNVTIRSDDAAISELITSSVA